MRSDNLVGDLGAKRARDQVGQRRDFPSMKTGQPGFSTIFRKKISFTTGFCN